MKFRLIEKTSQFESAYSKGTESFDIGGLGCDSFSVGALITVDTPSAKTFDSGTAATLVLEDLTYTAVEFGLAGRDITIRYVTGGTAGAEVVTVVGTAISVSMDATPVTGSTADDIKAAIDGSAEAAELVTVDVSGTGTDVQAAVAATALTGGTATEVNLANSSFVIPAHGLTTALKGRLTSTGTLPTGVTTGVDYFVIVLDEDTIQLASSKANALAGTFLVISDQGTSAAVNTFTPTALAGGSIKLQQSNDNENWVDLGSATTITTTTYLILEKDYPTSRYIRAYISLTAGHITADLQFLGKGDRDL